MSDKWLTSSTSDLGGRLRDTTIGGDRAAAGPHVAPPGPGAPPARIAPPRVTGSARVTPRHPQDGGEPGVLGWTEVRDTRIGWWSDDQESRGDGGPLSRVRRLLRNPRREP